MRPLPRALAATAVVAALTGTLGGCTSKPAASPTPTASASAKQANPLPVEPSYEGTPVGAASDLTITECPKEPGHQTAKATLKNSSQQARDYAVMIIWLKQGSGTPLGSGMQVVKGLQPGESRDVTIAADVVAKADSCVPNVKAGTIKG